VAKLRLMHRTGTVGTTNAKTPEGPAEVTVHRAFAVLNCVHAKEVSRVCNAPVIHLCNKAGLCGSMADPAGGGKAMLGDPPKQAFAVREAYEALLGLKKIADEATETAHAAELESFYLAVKRSEIDGVRRTLEEVEAHMNSPTFDATLSRVREKLETAASI
jgi:hypothetical protein